MIAVWLTLAVGMLIEPATSALVTSSMHSSLRLGQTGADKVVQLMRALDKDGDGRLDESEVMAFAATQGLDTAGAKGQFVGLDKNRNGALELTELAPAVGDTPPAGAANPQAAPASAMTPNAMAAPIAGVRPAFYPNPQAVSQPAAVSPPLAVPAKVVPYSAVVPENVAESAATVQPGTAQPAPAQPALTPSTAVSAQQLGDHLLTARGSAQNSAEQVAQQLQTAASAEGEARQLLAKAAVMRANATVALQLGQEVAQVAAEKAAQSATKDAMAELSKLENDAAKAELKASQLRARAQAATQEANDDVTAMVQALQASKNRH